MSPIQTLRILAPLCGAIVLVNAPTALAQDEPVFEKAYQYPAPAKTPEAAGEMFYQFLAAGVVMGGPANGVAFNVEAAISYLGSLSRAQAEEIEKLTHGVGPGDGPLKLLMSLARQKDEPQYEGKVVGKEGEQTLVEVVPTPAKKRAVVVIAEDGGYRVDVKATFGRWNDLSGEPLDIAWADSTGIVSPALATNTTYLNKKVRDSCQSNLKQTMLGILQYAQDYDEHYPTANKWIDNVMPYVKSEQIFRCSALPTGSNYGYALNQNLGALTLAKMNNPAQTVAIYETDDLTRNAYGVADERAYRHDGGSNIAFADGHIKWYAKGSEPAAEVSFKP